VIALATFPTFAVNPADRDLQNRVSLFIQQRQLSRGAHLTVLAQGGVVTLSGVVATFHQRQLLHSLTRHVAGVVQVRDELDVQTLDDDDNDLGRDDSRQTRIRVVC
jgi:osmotically-inducible protein OsmY